MSDGAYLLVLDSARDCILRLRQQGELVMSLIADVPLMRPFSDAQFDELTNTLLLATNADDDVALQRIDAINGTLLQFYSLPMRLRPALIAGFTVDSGGNLWMLLSPDAYTSPTSVLVYSRAGRLRAEFSLPVPIIGRSLLVDIAAQHMMVPTWDPLTNARFITVFNLQGEILFNLSLPRVSAASKIALAANSTVVMLDARGQGIYWIDATSGVVCRQLNLSISPTSLAVDQSTGDVFVAHFTGRWVGSDQQCAGLFPGKSDRRVQRVARWSEPRLMQLVLTKDGRIFATDQSNKVILMWRVQQAASSMAGMAEVYLRDN